MNKKNSEQLLIKKLYIKDISFENFLSSKKFTANTEPVVDINVKLSTTNIAYDDHHAGARDTMPARPSVSLEPSTFGAVRCARACQEGNLSGILSGFLEIH